MAMPATLPNGYLPLGIHQATQNEVIGRFGTGTARRQTLATRLQELLRLAQATGRLQRVFIWGSFVTDKPFPRDLDIFLLMQAGFDREFDSLPSTQRCVFEHEQARLLFDTDVFWATEAIGEEMLISWLSVYQLSRDMVQRGIVEVIFDD